MSKSLAERLREWRLAKGLTQTDAGRELSTPFRTYQDWERGVSQPGGYARACLDKMLATSKSNEPNQNPPPC